MNGEKKVADIILRQSTALLEDWLKFQLSSSEMRSDLINERDLREQSKEFLKLFLQAIPAASFHDISTESWTEMRAFLTDLSKTRAQQGFSPTETALFIMSLKEPLFKLLCAALAKESEALVESIAVVTALVDRLALFTTDAFIRSRQEIINRQAQDMLELSTPVVQVWNGVLALPLIGTLDSARTQVVMESLLQQIVNTGSQVAIIDITGVPTVDTLVAQHLLKTVSAARLMGAECIISGIRPQIAQTMVHLGVAFGDVVTKATLAEAIRHAFRLQGLAVVKTTPNA